MARATSTSSWRMRLAIGAAVVAIPLFASTVTRAEVDKKTERTWKANCASCHGADGKAQTEKGQKLAIPDMTAASWQSKNSDTQIRDRILNGVNETRDGIKKEMDPFKEKLKAEQVDALVKLVRSFGK